ncbi:hypothetical protein PAECIP112173_02769 [Paenibacillus sp. JJ-100]|nr:hypothetical protein PAECIP112173_02769 [Paenibacillus sp. JJ-100]
MVTSINVLQYIQYIWLLGKKVTTVEIVEYKDAYKLNMKQKTYPIRSHSRDGFFCVLQLKYSCQNVIITIR